MWRVCGILDQGPCSTTIVLCPVLSRPAPLLHPRLLSGRTGVMSFIKEQLPQRDLNRHSLLSLGKWSSLRNSLSPRKATSNGTLSGIGIGIGRAASPVDGPGAAARRACIFERCQSCLVRLSVSGCCLSQPVLCSRGVFVQRQALCKGPQS